MEELSRSQFILLVLLVSFVTSICTGIVTATLVNQAPSPITQIISRVIEKGMGTASVATTPVIVSTPVLSQEDRIIKLVDKVSPAIVRVAVFATSTASTTVLVESHAGFFVSADGLVVTSEQAVENEELKYSVILKDGRELSATVLFKDIVRDVAILKVAPISGEKFNFISFADSTKIKIGQTVIAIGQKVVSAGIISGLGENDFVQTDIVMSSGYSGGPLLDLDGGAVGINNTKFVLSSNIIKSIIDEVSKNL